MAENPFVGMSKAQLQALLDADTRQKTTGFSGNPAVRSGAPTAQGAADEYNQAVALLRTQKSALTSAQSYIDDLTRFNELNRGAGTGGLLDQFKFTAGARKLADPTLKEMDKLSTGLAAKQAAFKGQGGVSNFERQLFGILPPNIKDTGGVNSNTVNAAIALKNEEADRVGFMEAYLATNGTLNQADELWNAYVKAQPYRKTDTVTPDLARKYGYSAPGGKVVLNEKRVPWKQYFGANLGEIVARKPTAQQPAAPTAAPTAAQKPAGNSRLAGVGADWVLMKDGKGNRAWVSPDKSKHVEVH